VIYIQRKFMFAFEIGREKLTLSLLALRGTKFEEEFQGRAVV
jgi:hypothetical protein